MAVSSHFVALAPADGSSATIAAMLAAIWGTTMLTSRYSIKKKLSKLKNTASPSDHLRSFFGRHLFRYFSKKLQGIRSIYAMTPP